MKILGPRLIDRNNYRGYTLVVILGVCIIFLFLTFLGLTLDPLTGDLTRVGGYSENDYGWNNPQKIFEEPIYDYARSVDGYAKHYRVVVYGDSFSMNLASGWQNFYVYETKNTLITMTANDGNTVKDIISNPEYKKSSPAYFIYEVAERNLFSRTTEDVRSLSANGDRAVTLKEEKNTKTGNEPKTKLHYRVKNNGIKQFDYNAAADHAKKNILRGLFGGKTTDVRLLQLNRADLFSDRNSDKLLIFAADTAKSSLSDTQKETIVRNIEEIKNKVESNGKTRFVLLIPPDKLTVYWDYIRHKPGKNPSIIPIFKGKFEQDQARLELALKEAVSSGVDDIYLPNDTHWGAAGNEIAAKLLIDVFTVL